MVNIYLARHGETEENVAQILQGTLPGHLTAKGREQAEMLARELRQMPVKFDELWVSPLQRAVDTASVVNQWLKLPVVANPLLQERDWGSITGRQLPLPRDFEMPNDVETVEHMYLRAHKLLLLWQGTCLGKSLLVVAHGLFNRVLLAAWQGVTIGEVPRMQNGEVRHMVLNSVPHHDAITQVHSLGHDMPSAN